MSDAEQWAANKKFIDRAIARGDEILLSGPLTKTPSGFQRELEYLTGKLGYRLSADGSRLLPPK